MSTRPSFDDLFEHRSTFPDPDARERLARLVGLDDHKERLTKMLALLVNPQGLRQWADRFHPHAWPELQAVLRRPPLVVLAGDVGSGKTELASTIGDAVARQEDIDVTLLPLSLSARGQGRVGEMTQLVSAAFDHAAEEAAKLVTSDSSKPARGAVLLLVDEADALAQSREATQMHHEDRAGVNAFIRGVDRLADAKLPAAVVMCTNRLGALDPAVRRRAAEILTFGRPTDEQRKAVLSPFLGALRFNDKLVDMVVSATGPTDERDHGLTFSDLTQRLLPAIVLDAYPTSEVSSGRVLEIAARTAPTPPFTDHAT